MALSLIDAVGKVLRQRGKPVAIILAGHNGSGKSTMWYRHLADQLEMPLINADRMMLSILPEPNELRQLPMWAQSLRDTNELWMGIAQRGVQAFVAQAMASQAAFAMETVFSHWKLKEDGSFESKIDTITQLQQAGYFVLLIFVGLANVNLSMGRVHRRKLEGGHDVHHARLTERFPRTQKAINAALDVADAAILVDNSRGFQQAFTPVHVRHRKAVAYDIRTATKRPAKEIRQWLNVVAPIAS